MTILCMLVRGEVRVTKGAEEYSLRLGGGDEDRAACGDVVINN